MYYKEQVNTSWKKLTCFLTVEQYETTTPHCRNVINASLCFAFITLMEKIRQSSLRNSSGILIILFIYFFLNLFFSLTSSFLTMSIKNLNQDNISDWLVLLICCIRLVGRNVKTYTFSSIIFDLCFFMLNLLLQLCSI